MPSEAQTSQPRQIRIEGVALPGGRVADLVTEGDPNSRTVAHHRVVDTVALLARNGTITGEMALAAQDFARDFRAAHFSTIKTSSLLKVDAGRNAEPTPGHEGAKRRVLRDLDALGGLGSPAARAVWHVIGLQESLREWAMTDSWQGKPMRYFTAQGVLVAALGVLSRVRGRGGLGITRKNEADSTI
jgi:hypothetical protein